MREEAIKRFEEGLGHIRDNWRTFTGETDDEKLLNAITIARLLCIELLDTIDKPLVKTLTEEEYNKKVEEGKKIKFAEGGKD